MLLKQHLPGQHTDGFSRAKAMKIYLEPCALEVLAAELKISSNPDGALMNARVLKAVGYSSLKPCAGRVAAELKISSNPDSTQMDFPERKR